MSHTCSNIPPKREDSLSPSKPLSMFNITRLLNNCTHNKKQGAHVRVKTNTKALEYPTTLISFFFFLVFCCCFFLLTLVNSSNISRRILHKALRENIYKFF